MFCVVSDTSEVLAPSKLAIHPTEGRICPAAIAKVQLDCHSLPWTSVKVQLVCLSLYCSWLRSLGVSDNYYM